MKKNALIVFVYVAFSLVNVTFGQHTITYNFLGTPAVVGPPPIAAAPPSITFSKYRPKQKMSFVKKGEFSVFQIDEINPFIYDVTIKSETTDFNTTPPPVFELFFDTEKFAKPDAIANAAAAAGATFGTLVKSYKDGLQNLEFTKELYDNMVSLAYSENKTRQEIYTDIDKLDALGNLVFENPRINTNQVTILKKCQDAYNALQSRYQEVNDKFEALAAPSASEIKQYKDIVQTNAKVTGFDYKSLFNKIAYLYEKLRNPRFFIVASSPLLADKDIIKYSVGIKPKKELKNVQVSREEKFDVPLLVKGGVKVDFSTGLFFTLDQNLLNHSYRLESPAPSTPPSTDKTLRENLIRDQFIPSIGAMVHISKRSPSWIKPGLSLGLGVKSTNLENSSYFLGISAIAGYDERFILTLGIAGSKVEFLKPQYSVGQTVPSSTDEKLLTEKVFRLGNLLSFVSLTYNLTKKNTK